IRIRHRLFVEKAVGEHYRAGSCHFKRRVAGVRCVHQTEAKVHVFGQRRILRPRQPTRAPGRQAGRKLQIWDVGPSAYDFPLVAREQIGSERIIKKLQAGKKEAAGIVGPAVEEKQVLLFLLEGLIVRGEKVSGERGLKKTSLPDDVTAG